MGQQRKDHREQEPCLPPPTRANRIERCDASIRPAPLRAHVGDQDPHPRAQTPTALLIHQSSEVLLKLALALRHHQEREHKRCRKRDLSTRRVYLWVEHLSGSAAIKLTVDHHPRQSEEFCAPKLGRFRGPLTEAADRLHRSPRRLAGADHATSHPSRRACSLFPTIASCS